MRRVRIVGPKGKPLTKWCSDEPSFVSFEEKLVVWETLRALRERGESFGAEVEDFCVWWGDETTTWGDYLEDRDQYLGVLMEALPDEDLVFLRLVNGNKNQERS
jgi:hypothetical protein